MNDSIQEIFAAISAHFQAVFSNITIAVVFPVFIIFFLMLFFLYYLKILQPETNTSEWIQMKKERDQSKLSFLFDRHPITMSDVVPLGVITAFFLFIAIFNLGSTADVDVMAEVREHSRRHHKETIFFDEIYFVRTAVEHIENLNPYETSHPPLGKNIIAGSILAFGMSPFGWRLVGAICGMIMVLVMYVFLKNMFGKTAVATCGSLILGFEFMRFVHSRMGTIDTYVVLFILLSFYFMYRYMSSDPDATFSSSLPALALSGIFFGLSFAVKWTGFYAGAGLLIMYIIRLVHLGIHYNSYDRPSYAKYLIKTFLCSFLFFVLIPVIVYYLSYIPYGTARGMTIEGGMLWSSDYFNLVWSNQVSMFNYHSKLVAEHGGSSHWWQWLLNIKPIMYVNNHKDGLRAAYGGFGNPVLYWGGLFAMITMAIRVFTHRDSKALFILIGYLSGLLPWVAVTRIVFAYHYFPSSLFLVFALAHLFNTMLERNKPGAKLYVYGYTAVTGSVFAMFYPALSGMYLPMWYYTHILRWFGNWPI
ncbi:MAG: phospholipid carrier-dependent glycosyltransferase [Oscillospiraceae bacterium]|nr:phospholipid carrier-dependent glycosyltransferase [Oscillospiraceae bacterium]